MVVKLIYDTWIISKQYFNDMCVYVLNSLNLIVRAGNNETPVGTQEAVP